MVRRVLDLLGVGGRGHDVDPPSSTEVCGATGPVVTRFGASSPVLGDAPLGGRRATAGSAHLAAARDPVPLQVRRTVRPLPGGEVAPP